MMIISTLCIPFFGTRAGVPEPKRQLMSGAYLMDKANVDLRDEDAQHLTHLFYSFGLIEDGRLKTSHLRHWQQMTSFRDRHPHIQLILAVGGMGSRRLFAGRSVGGRARGVHRFHSRRG